ncbi:MAG: type II CAAX endopeptidase family protein [Bacteroidota bacterium]
MMSVIQRYSDLTIGTIGIILSSFLFSWFGSLFDSTPFVKNGIQLLLPCALFVLAYWFHKKYSGFNLTPSIGSKNRLRHAFILGGTIGFSISGVAFVCAYALGYISHPLLLTSPGKLLSTILTQAVVGSYEEIIFRGLLFLGLLIRSKNLFISAFLSAVLFSLIHFQSYSLTHHWYTHLGIVSIGMVLGYIYFITKSLWAPIALHFANNFFGHILIWQDIPININNYTFTDLTQSSLNIFVCLLFSVFLYKNREKYSVESFLSPTPSIGEKNDLSIEEQSIIKS